MWHTFIYNPLNNAFVFILSNVPGNSVALAVIIFTLVIKFALAPLYQKSIRSQQALKLLQPKIAELQKKYKDKKDRAVLGQKTLELYKENNVNPFISIGVLLIQLPILLALYLIFSKGISANVENLYSFVHFPETVGQFMFGYIDTAKPFILLGLLAGATQGIQARISFPKPEVKETKKGENPSFQDEFAKSMRFQVLYILPIFIILVSLKLPSAVTLYFVVANVFGIFQEMYVKKHIHIHVHKI
jgi:YidC/Oxa1 family membrane protein insertase